MLRVLDAPIAGAKRIHVTHADDVVGALKYRVMHYYDDADDDIVNAATTVVKDVSDWESWTPTDPLQTFLKMGVDVFERENTF